MDHRACREIEVQRQEALGQERAKSRRDELGAGGQDGGQLCMRGVCCGPDVSPQRESHFKCCSRGLCNRGRY